MKKLLILLPVLLVGLLLEVNTAKASTEVSGIYWENTTWTEANSPYVLTGDVQIPTGVTLTIQPGVNVQYSGEYEILIMGIFVASGTSDKKITFMSENVRSSSGSRPMLIFKGTDLSSSEMNYLEMKYLGEMSEGNNYNSNKILQIGEETEHNQGHKNIGTLTISNLEILNGTIKTNGYETGSSLTISGAIITSSTIIGVYPRSEAIEIDNAIINDSTIISDSYNHGITLQDSIVVRTNLKIGCCGANITVSNSLLSASNISEGGGSPVNGPLTIDDSILVNTPIDLPYANVSIINTTDVFSGSRGIKFGNGEITYSRFIGPNSGTAIEITGYVGYNFGGTINISDSTITQNDVGIRFTGPNEEVVINNCNLLENNQYNIENLSLGGITADNNYWGTTDPVEIAEKIYDYYDDIELGETAIVTYQSSLSQTANTAPNSASEVIISSVNPVTGDNGAINSVLITGSGFDPASMTATLVGSDGSQVIDLTEIVNDLTQMSFTIPSDCADDTYDVVLERDSDHVSSVSVNSLTLVGPTPTLEPLALTTVSPVSVNNNQANTVILTGSGFETSGMSLILTNSSGTQTPNISLTVNNSTTATFIVPVSLTADIYNVTVNRSSDNSSATKQDALAVVQGLRITTILPASVVNNRPNTITITGAGFGQGLQFSLTKSNGTSVTGLTITVNNSTSATFIIPSGFYADTYDVVLTRPSDNTTATKQDGFTVVEPTPALIAMPESSGSPQIRILNKSGTELKTFWAFSQSARGGFNAVMGDINDDKIQEVIVAPLSGEAPMVRVFNQAGTKLYEFYAYDRNFRGGVALAAGDVDNDGVDEIVTLPYSNGGSNCRIFGLRSGSIVPTTLNFFIFPEALRGGFSLAMPDFEGDGLHEIAVAPLSKGSAHLQVFGYRANTRSYQAVILGLKVYGEDYHGGVKLAAGDLDGDGDDEVVTSIYSHGSPHIVPIYRKSNGTLAKMNPGFYAFDQNYHGGINVATLDYNSDGVDEIAATLRAGSNSTVRILNLDGSSILSEFKAFATGFTGGVTVSSGLYIPTANSS